MLDAAKISLGIHPVTWTNDDLPELGAKIPFEQCINEMAQAGFEGCEIGNKFPKDPIVLKDVLASRGLQICNAWFSTFFITQDKKDIVEAFIAHRDMLHILGAKIIGCSEQSNSIQQTDRPVLADSPVFSEKEWRKVADGMNILADLAAEKDMKVCVHHHMGTGVQTPEEIDRLFDLTNDNVYLLYDSGHIVFSEGDVQVAYDVLQKHIRRVLHIHLKDVREVVYHEAVKNGWSFLYAVKQGVFTVPGDGMIDFKPIFDVIAQSSYTGWMLAEAEQDPAKAAPLKYAKMAREYIRRVGGI